jgi:3-phosphoshikimate 1-carboxyvinyltransferase
MGIEAQILDDGLRIVGGQPEGAHIDTYDDHRIAMSFAVAGLKAEKTVISDEACVAKSFPKFWEVLAGLYPRHALVPGENGGSQTTREGTL